MRKCWSSVKSLHVHSFTDLHYVFSTVHLFWCIYGGDGGGNITLPLCAVCSGEFTTQQQPPLDAFTGWLWNLTFDFSAPPVPAPGPIFFLISAAMVMKACSTLVALFALVSRNGIPRESANSWDTHRQTIRTPRYAWWFSDLSCSCTTMVLIDFLKKQQLWQYRNDTAHHMVIWMNALVLICDRFYSNTFTWKVSGCVM